MDQKLFDDLCESIEQAGAYLRGETELPAERIRFVDEPDPRAIRERLGLNQEQFAAAMAVSVRTLQNWEQGRREPTGAAMQLLRIVDKHPEVLMELV